MNNTNPIQKNRSSEFTAAYLRLLSGQEPAQEDWPAAAELINAGMATGHVHRSATTAAREIDALRNFAPTLQGRLYAEQLREQVKARSLIGRLQKWIWALCGAVGGLIADTLSGLLKDAVQRLIGW